MNLHFLRPFRILLPAICLVSDPISAAEFYDEARVIRAEPIVKIEVHRTLSESCLGAKPVTDNLIELLNWDLGTGHCELVERTETITGYRVFYRWDNQEFKQVMIDHPGETIPVRVVLN